MRILFSFFIFLFIFKVEAQVKSICITLDDVLAVTYGQNTIEYNSRITKKLIQTFNSFQIPAIGYVNEIQLYSNGKRDSLKIELLEMWLKNGYDIGNHTYSHLDFNKVNDSIYFDNIKKGEVISQQLMQKYGRKIKYFRHPFLHTGLDKTRNTALNKFLSKHHYIISPVTIDNEDYLFARFYHKAFLENNEHLMQEIGKVYVDYMEQKLVYFEKKSEEVFGRNISQTLLIHANLLNADYLDELAAMYKKNGYTFVSQDEILKDKVYQTTESYFTSNGISWIYRWAISLGMDKKIMEDDILTPENIVQMNRNYYSNNNSKIDTLTLFDKVRKRLIPIAIFKPNPDKLQNNKDVIIFNHGYGQNKGGDYLAYSYLTEYLATKGYFVVSIQHELSTDSLMPLTGVPQIVRRPFWDRGADNILFVINELKKTNPELNFNHITLIGHSNGADMAALFAQKFPNVAYKVITLDNRRMALPKSNDIKVYSLRSSDQHADEGVLPTTEEQKKFGIKIIKLPNTIHNDMDDHANSDQRQEIKNYVLTFLNE